MTVQFGFDTRKETANHRAKFSNAMHFKDYEVFEEVFKLSFSNKPAVHPAVTEKSKYDILNEKQELREAMSQKFYESNYIEPRLSRGVHSEKGIPIAQSEFCAKVTNCPNGNKRNNFYFLLGPVGTGKTAFINKLITKHGDEWIDKGVFFVRLDAYTPGIKEKHNLECDDLLVYFVEKCARILKAYEENDGLRKKIKYDHEVHSMLKDFLIRRINEDAQSGERCKIAEENLATFFNYLRLHYGLSPLIIIDNIDQIFHSDDRRRFLGNINYKNDKIRYINDLIGIFFHTQLNLGNIGANILLSMREDTYDVLQHGDHLFNSNELFDDNRNVFCLEEVNWRTVVENRFNHLEYICNKLNQEDSKLKPIKELASKIKESVLTDNEKLVSSLKGLSSYGLRDIIEFFREYSYVRVNDNPSSRENIILNRYFDHYRLGVLTYMLDGYRSYSQLRTNFPNLYLNNSEKYIHKPTYWLKRLISEFIYFKFKNKVTCNKENILPVFCDDGYEEKLVCECIGSLCEVHKSCICSAVYRPSQRESCIVPKEIEMTTRGKYLLDGFIDQFMYLQLIIEDPQLYLPSQILSDLRPIDDTDYGYVVCGGYEYYQKKKKMIQTKAIQVTKFIQLLKVSLKYEKEMYPKVFKNLEKIIKIDMTKIENNLKSEFLKLSDEGIIIPISAIDGIAKDSYVEYDKVYKGVFTS